MFEHQNDKRNVDCSKSSLCVHPASNSVALSSCAWCKVLCAVGEQRTLNVQAMVHARLTLAMHNAIKVKSRTGCTPLFGEAVQRVGDVP